MAAANHVDISGLDRCKLLLALWERGMAQRFGVLVEMLSMPPVPDPVPGSAAREEAAVRALAAGRIDYFDGVAIKCDLEPDMVNPWLYDRDQAAGAFAAVVAALRARRAPVP